MQVGADLHARLDKVAGKLDVASDARQIGYRGHQAPAI
jgi:hypothetical protein